MRPLVIGIGNPLLGDDRVGLEAAEQIRNARDDVDVEDAVGTGFELLDLIEGRDHVLMVDAVCTETAPPGTLQTYQRDDFRHALATGPHYAGLPDALALADEIGLPLPGDLRVLAVEIEKKYEFQEHLSPVIETAVPRLLASAHALLDEWTEVPLCTSTA